MFTRHPDLSDALVAEAIQREWGVSVDSIEYAPVGFGGYHWTVDADKEAWFVTVVETTSDRGRDNLVAALLTAKQLRDAGLEWVVAPIASRSGQVVASLADRFTVALYPHMSGESHGWGPYPDPESRMAVVDRLIELHAEPLRSGANALVDDFAIPSRADLDGGLEADTRWDSGPFGESARELLVAHAASVRDRLLGYDGLVEKVANRTESNVITHGEPHRGNTISTVGGPVLIDWDTLLVAPRERDLWWFADDPAVLEHYRRVSGAVLDASALELYRQRWTLTDLALFAAQFRNPHDRTSDTETAWQGFQDALASA